MKKTGILNPDIISVISAMGHKDTLVIADAGLPVPEGVPCIDISLTRGIPSFTQALRAVAEELVIESFIVAGELPEKNPAVWGDIQNILQGFPCEYVPHEMFKEKTASAKAVIRTGETSSYANVILTAGVNF
ncbi:MAG: D-ribose pyranase [Treponema sp.]|jgi:D-ribose pyranase|nr:D-ribose pyranase [Treponema sp.]